MEVLCPGEENDCGKHILFQEIKTILQHTDYEVIYPLLLYNFLSDENHMEEYKECRNPQCDNVIRRRDNVKTCELCMMEIRYSDPPTLERYQIASGEEDMDLEGGFGYEEDGEEDEILDRQEANKLFPSDGLNVSFV